MGTSQRPAGMKVLLRNRKTGEYFRSPGTWTEKKEEAFAFPDSSSARNFYMGHYLPDVEVVSLKDGDSGDETGPSGPKRSRPPDAGVEAD